MWGSPYFSPIASPAGAAGNGFAPRANQPQLPPGVQQQIPQATPMQFPIARPAGVPSFTRFGSPPRFPSPFNQLPVSQSLPKGSQMMPPTNQLANRSPIRPPPGQQSLPFSNPPWQIRNSQPSPRFTPQQSFIPAPVPSPRGAVTPPQKPSMRSPLPSPRGVITPTHQPNIPSTMPSPIGVLSSPQRPFMQSTMPSPGGVLTRPQPPCAPTVPSPGGVPSSLPIQRPFVAPNAPSPAGIPSTHQRQITSFTVPSPGGSIFSPPQSPRPFVVATVPSPGGNVFSPPPSPRPFVVATVPSPGGNVFSPPPSPRPFASASVPSPGGVLSPPPPQRPFTPPMLTPPGGFQIPTQRPFKAPTIPSPRRVFSPPQQALVSATCPSPRGMAAAAQPPSPFNSPSLGGFPSPQRPFVPTTLPSPRGNMSPAQQMLPFNNPSRQNPRTSGPGLNQRPTVMPSSLPSPRGIRPQFQHSSPFTRPQLPPRSPRPSGPVVNQGSLAAALDRHIIEKQMRNAASGGFKQMPVSMSGQGTNLRHPGAHQWFIPISQPAQRRSTSSSHPHTRAGFYKDGERSRGQGNRRNYSNKSPRIPRCFSPPPPDIVRVMKCVMSEEYYTKKKNDQVDNCDVQGTDKLTDLHNRFEKEILNMASLEQDDNDDESIGSGRSHQKDCNDSDVESLSESDANDIPVKSRLRLFPSDDEENSDEDSSEVESHALSDSTSDSDNDDDDSMGGGGLSDDDGDDAGYEHEHKGASVAEIRKRKIEDPCRLHPELWFNEAGESNDGPVCRCSSSDKQQGIRHGIYPGETVIMPCDPLTNNVDRLHHYWVTVTPHTNFMTSNPSIIHAEGKDYTFEGFSMFCHHPLEQVPLCSVIRFNIEYTLHVISQPVPENFCIKDLELFSQFLFYKVLELADWTLSGNVQDSCQRYHFMPRFVHRQSDREYSKACHELLPMSQVLSHILNSAEPLVKLSHFDVGKEKWEEYNKSCMNAIVMNPAKKPAALRVDDLQFCKDKDSSCKSKVYIVHHSIRPVQMSFAGDPKYQRLLKTHNKLRNLISNTAVPTRKNQDKLVKLKIELEKMRLTGSMRRDVVVEVRSRGMVKTGLKSDICQYALLLPVLVNHVRYHMCLHSLDDKMGYVFKDRALLQLALTHPSYHLNFGMNPDHARNSLSNCGVKQPRYGDRKVRHLHTRKKGITQLIRVMSNLGKMEEHQSIFADDYGTLANYKHQSTSRRKLIGSKARNKLERIRHNERLEFLGDAVLELISSAHLYFMLPSKPEGGLAMYRSALVQNRHLAQLAKKLGLSDYMQYSHGPDLCLEEDLNHAMANCFEALLGAMYLESGLKPATELFTKVAFEEEELREVWTNLPEHPLQAQQPDGDRHLIASSELLQKLQEFEQASGIEFTHIRLLARAFTHPQVGFNNLTLGSNQRMEFLGDSVLQFVVSVYLYKHFPEHHEGHLTLLRSSLVNHRIQAKLARELGLDKLINFGGQQVGIKTFREKLLADILEAFVAALYVDKGLRHVEVFCRVCLFPRLEEFIINQDWMDAKSQLQQCCLTAREQGKTPDLPQYKVLQNKGPAHHKHYTVAVYYKNKRLGSGEGKSIQQAEMAAAKDALGSHYFPELARQKRLLDRKHQGRRRNYWNKAPRTERERENEDQGEVEFKPRWEEMETFEAAQNRPARENRGDDGGREYWETEERNSEGGEDYDDERSDDGRENWEEEMSDTKKNWEDEVNDKKDNWEEKQNDTTEIWEEENSDTRESLEGGGGVRKEDYEREQSVGRENWEDGKSNSKGNNWEAGNSDEEEDWEEEMNHTGETWEKESNDGKDEWEEDKQGAREEEENWDIENFDSKDDNVKLKENCEEN